MRDAELVDAELPIYLAKTIQLLDAHSGSSPPSLPDARHRYEDRGLLGAGGMGEVRLCKDQLIGREIALKVIRAGRTATNDARRRFLCEARVQGQLEHPSIVPVYDLGLNDHGDAYFAMK